MTGETEETGEEAIDELVRHGEIGQLATDLGLKVLEEVQEYIETAKRDIEAISPDPYLPLFFPDGKPIIYAPEAAIAEVEDAISMGGIRVGDKDQTIYLRDRNRVDGIVQRCKQQILGDLPISVTSKMAPSMIQYAGDELEFEKRIPVMNGKALKTFLRGYTE